MTTYDIQVGGNQLGVVTDWLGAVVAMCATVLLLTLYSLWSRKCGHTAIQKWAQEMGLEIVRAERRSFVPHWGAISGKGYQFFRIHVRDNHGLISRAWVRCLDSGSTDPSTVEVIWDEK